eukprot:846109_1
MNSNQENRPPLLSNACQPHSAFFQSNSIENKHTINKWKSKRVATCIGDGIYLRFGNTSISLGLRWSEKDHKQHSAYGLDFIDFLKHLNNNVMFSVQQRRNLIQTYEQTMTLKYLSEHFVYWADVENDVHWKRSVQCYLDRLRYFMLSAIHHHALTDIQSTSIAQFQNKITAIQLEYKQQLDAKQKEINKMNAVLALQTDTISNLERHCTDQHIMIEQQKQRMKHMNQRYREEMRHRQQHNKQKDEELQNLRRDKKKLQRKCHYRDTQVAKLKTNQIITTRIPINDSKRALQLQRRRADRLLSKSEHLTMEKDRSRVLTEAVHNRYPSHYEHKQAQFVKSANKEVKQIERTNAAQQFRRDIEYGMTQKQARVQRKNLFETKNKRHQTSQGVIVGGVSSTSSKDKARREYVADLVDDGTACLPLLLRDGKLVLYTNYYRDLQHSKQNQKDPNLKQDRRQEKKKGLHDCGVAIATTRNIQKSILKRLTQLATDPDFARISKFHELNYINNPQTIITFPRFELAITFDGAGTQHSRPGNDRTQAHILNIPDQEMIAHKRIYCLED